MLDMGEPKALLSLAINAPDESGIEYAVLLLKEVNYCAVPNLLIERKTLTNKIVLW